MSDVPARSSDPASPLDVLVAGVIGMGVRRVHVLGWRDLDDDDAGGSEHHADQFMRRWAAAGLDVTHRTSHAPGRPDTGRRNGYRVIRRGSRYSVFPRTAVAEVARAMGPADALVEIMNGVPWFSPVWYRRGPRMTILHHVHGPMWDQIMPRPFAGTGRFLESRLAPPFYRGTLTVTPSTATRDELIELGFRPEMVTAVDNGIDEFFTPDPVADPKAHRPTVVAAGRLAPVKRFDVLLPAALEARTAVGDVELVLVGEGPQRGELERWVDDHDARAWVRFTGRVGREQLRAELRRSWVVASASIAEGWGLTLTEGAACGTPAVASDIAGHRCSVVDGVTGVLAPVNQLGAALSRVLGSHDLRSKLAAAAVDRARSLTWAASATGVTRVFHEAVARYHRRSCAPSS